MRLSPDTAARIKACQGVYSLSATARHFNVSKKTVHDAWHGKTHTGVSAALEPDNVISTRVPADVIVEDGRTLLQRGMSLQEAAQQIGVGRTTLYNHIREAAPLLLVV